MTLLARSALSTAIDSRQTGLEMGRQLREAFVAGRPAALLLFSTINHNQAALLEALREVVGREVPAIGCSAQGIMARGRVIEDGYAAGALALGGSALAAAAACVEGIEEDSFGKGAELGRRVMAGLGRRPRALVLLYDPLCGTDIEVFLAGLFEQVACPILGGGASQPPTHAMRSFQYFGDRVLEHAAVAVGLAGDFGLETDFAMGASPIGVEMTVTRSEGTKILELDGRPALDVLDQITQADPALHDHASMLGIGLPAQGAEDGNYQVRAAYGTDPAARAFVIQSALPPGTRIMLHHRTVERVLNGTAEMAGRLQARLQGKRIRAALGFECGARTKPFLGPERTLQENVVLQQAVAAGAEWLGLLAWGEIFPMGGRPTFHNYAYPLLLLAD